jgi:CubicO group peptidase (beta-lactamase class C family)
MKGSRKLLIIRLLLFVGTAISLFYVPWPIIKTWIKPLPKTVEEQVKVAAEENFDGIIVYVDQEGVSPEFYAAGWHNRAAKIPANPQALFKIASIGKLYHAVAITKLVDKGVLSIDATLSEYFPELVGKIEYADEITLRMLVQHRSGLPNFTDMADFWNNPPEDSKAALKLIENVPAEFEPNKRYQYSNTNYLLLSELIKKVTEYDSEFQYFKEAILMPLGLENTYGSINEIDMNRLMSGYYVGVEEDIKTTNYGSMIATAEDVGIFLRALNDGSIFNESEKGLYASLYTYNHTGLIPGYQSIAKYHSDIDAVVIQFVNTTNFDGYTWSEMEVIYNRIVKIWKREHQL